jgi:hypothetical protein
MRLVSVTPISPSFPHALTELTRGIRIIERPTFAETNWRFWNMRRTDEEALLKRTHWLYIERESDWCNHKVLSDMADDLRTAMLGFQLWVPLGWDGLILDCRQVENHNSLSVERVHYAEQYAPPLWATTLDIGKFDPAEVPALVGGTFLAVESGIVPIINPFRFLEIGLQTALNHRRAGAVLWMMGLDGLLAAGSQTTFSRHLQKLLGPDTRVFPDDWVGRRPTYTVAELASDMYEYRSLIAHGREILQKYRDPIKVEYEHADLTYLPAQEWSHGTLMIESIAFCLIAALRRVIAEGLMDRIKTQRVWKRWLDAPT